MSTKHFIKNKALPLGSVAAGLGALGAANTASADIIYYNPGVTTMYVPNDAVFVDIVGGVASTNNPSIAYNFQLRDNSNKPAKPTLAGTTGLDQISHSSFYVAKLNFGDLISGVSNQPVGGSSAYMAKTVNPPYGSGIPAGPWATPNDGTGYVGFSIQPDATTLYGWMNLTYTASSGLIAINNWAYDDSGAGIQAGQTAVVPEPGETALIASLLAGSAALYARRRKNKAA